MKAYVDGIKEDLKDAGCGEVDGTELVSDRVQWGGFVDTALNHRAGRFLIRCCSGDGAC